jgi:2-polyprenyl-6-methoxyphenol hydroxylase-like FAD-dependent oxidoreductase
VLALPQVALQEELAAALGGAGVHVAWGHRLRTVRGGRAPVAELERLRNEAPAHEPPLLTVAERLVVRPRFVVGADGSSSAVRRSLGLELEQQGPPHRLLATEVARAGYAGRDLRILVGDEHIDAVWPLLGGRHRCSLQLPSGVEEERRFAERALWAPHPDGERVGELLARRVPWLVGPVAWSGVARFERRLARSYGAHAVWLAGDAAHTTSPLGVQSLNLGLREGMALADALADALTGDGRALARYDATFRAEWALLHGAVPLAADDPWLQRVAPRLVGALPATGAVLVALLQRLGLRPAAALPSPLTDPDARSVVRAS